MAELKNGTTIGGFTAYHDGNLTNTLVRDKLKEVDGHGSGIDADLLDGKHANEFANSTHTHTKSNITDFSHTHTAGDLPSASTSAKGIVQLNNDTNSTSTTQAATANSVKAVYDLTQQVRNDLIDLINSGVGSGVGTIIQFKNKVIINNDTNTINIGIPEYNKLKDILLVFQNGMYIHQDADFTVNNSNQIIKSSGNWEKDTIFEFIVIASVSGNSDVFLTNAYTKIFVATSNNTSVIPIGIPEYNKFTDVLEVYFKNLVLYEGDNYTIGTDSINLVGTALEIGEKILFRVLKKVRTDVTAIDSNQIKIIDDVNGNKYLLKISNGLLYLKEVE